MSFSSVSYLLVGVLAFQMGTVASDLVAVLGTSSQVATLACHLLYPPTSPTD